MELKDVLTLVEEVRDEYQRDMDQALLKDQLRDAQFALGGRDACDKLARRLGARSGIYPLVLRSAQRPK